MNYLVDKYIKCIDEIESNIERIVDRVLNDSDTAYLVNETSFGVNDIDKVNEYIVFHKENINDERYQRIKEELKKNSIEISLETNVGGNNYVISYTTQIHIFLPKVYRRAKNEN